LHDCLFICWEFFVTCMSPCLCVTLRMLTWPVLFSESEMSFWQVVCSKARKSKIKHKSLPMIVFNPVGGCHRMEKTGDCGCSCTSTHQVWHLCVVWLQNLCLCLCKLILAAILSWSVIYLCFHIGAYPVYSWSRRILIIQFLIFRM
jgi:hypothetical protein